MTEHTPDPWIIILTVSDESVRISSSKELNPHLILAAPEMLRVLKYFTSTKLGDSPLTQQQAWLDAVEIIKKVEGDDS